LAVSNYYGVWFKVQKRDTIFEAKRVARDELHLPKLPMFGMDIVALKASGTAPTRPPSRAPSRAAEAPPAPASEHESEPEVDMNMAFASSQTTRARPPYPPRRGPRGTGDDPYTLGYLKEEQPKRGACLEGQAPQIYDSDQSKTMDFLTEFKRFMLMNSGATIAGDPIRRSAYFLSLLRGPHIDGWKMRQYEWLDRVDTDPRDLPFGMSAWQVLEREFHKAFEDYAHKEKALDDLECLRMKDGRIDEYIAAFQQLVHCADMFEDDPNCL